MADYLDILQRAVDKEADVIGDRAIEIAEENGIKFDSEGNIQEYKGIGRKKLEKIVKEYSEIGGDVTASLIAREIRRMDTSDVRLPKIIEEKV